VAKFYDPLYQDLQMPTGRGVDAFFAVDFCYSHECAAYQRLVDLQGAFIPQLTLDPIRVSAYPKTP
jgi:hypothetical protein